MMAATKMHDFEGMVLMPANLLFQMIQTAVDDALERREKQTTDEAQELPEEMAAIDAARFLHYKNTRSLKQYEGTDLKPIRRNRKLFYKSSELVKLKKILFSQ